MITLELLEEIKLKMLGLEVVHHLEGTDAYFKALEEVYNEYKNIFDAISKTGKNIVNCDLTELLKKLKKMGY